MEKQVVRIRLDITDPEEVRQFRAVKKDRGVIIQTELIRLLIREAYKQIQKSEVN